MSNKRASGTEEKKKRGTLPLCAVFLSCLILTAITARPGHLPESRGNLLANPSMFAEGEMVKGTLDWPERWRIIILMNAH